MTVRAHVNYDWPTQRLELTVMRDDDRTTEVWRGPDGWVSVDPQVIVEPSLRFSWEMAPAVLEAFQRHLQTANGYVPTDARTDYLAERARVDRLIGAVISGSRDASQ